MSHFHILTLDSGRNTSGEYEFDSFEEALAFFVRTLNTMLEDSVDLDMVRPKVEMVMMLQGFFTIETMVPIVFKQCMDECELMKFKVIRN